MMSDIDYKKLLEQEPDFKRYAEQVVFDAVVASNADFLKFIHTMWQVGNSIEQTTQVIKSMMQPQGGQQ